MLSYFFHPLIIIVVSLMTSASRVALRLEKATFVAASPSDLLWLDQSDLVAAIDEHPEIRARLEKTATATQNVSFGRARNRLERSKSVSTSPNVHGGYAPVSCRIGGTIWPQKAASGKNDVHSLP